MLQTGLGNGFKGTTQISLENRWRRDEDDFAHLLNSLSWYIALKNQDFKRIGEETSDEDDVKDDVTMSMDSVASF